MGTRAVSYFAPGSLSRNVMEVTLVVRGRRAAGSKSGATIAAIRRIVLQSSTGCEERGGKPAVHLLLCVAPVGNRNEKGFKKKKKNSPAAGLLRMVPRGNMLLLMFIKVLLM